MFTNYVICSIIWLYCKEIQIKGGENFMDRMKTFGLLALATLLFFLFSNIMINVAIKSSYAPMDTYITLRDNVKVDIKEAKATYANGYVGGKITNNGETKQKAYIKIDLYSKRDVLLGTKYVTLEDWKQEETKDFRMGFRFTDTDYCRVSVVDEIPEQVQPQQLISQELKGVLLITTVIMLCYFG